MNKPPAVPEIETQILGAILIDNDAALKAFQILRSKHFFSTTNGTIFEIMLTLFENSTPIDLITVIDGLKKIGKLEECGGMAYINKLSMNIISSANIETHCKILIEKWILRSIIKIGKDITNKAFNQQNDAFELSSYAVTEIENIINVMDKKEEVNFYDRLPEIFKQIELERENKIEATLRSKEYPSFNKVTGGLRPGNLILISGPTKASKTRFSISLIRDFAVNSNVSIGLIGLEMQTDEYDRLLISMQTGTRYGYLRDPGARAIDGHLRFKDEDLKTTKDKAFKSFKGTNILICDSVFLDIELFAKIRYWVHKYNIQVIAVDYIQLIPVSEDMERRDMVVAHISRNLKNIARQMRINIIEISQENQQGRTAEGTGPEKDCDFWFSCWHPVDSGKESIKVEKEENNVRSVIDFPVDESIFQIRFKASRHSKNGGAFLMKLYENGEYKELDPNH